MGHKQRDISVQKRQRIADLEYALSNLVSSPHKHKENCVILEVSQEDIDYAIKLLREQ